MERRSMRTGRCRRALQGAAALAIGMALTAALPLELAAPEQAWATGDALEVRLTASQPAVPRIDLDDAVERAFTVSTGSMAAYVRLEATLDLGETSAPWRCATAPAGWRMYPDGRWYLLEPLEAGSSVSFQGSFSVGEDAAWLAQLDSAKATTVREVVRADALAASSLQPDWESEDPWGDATPIAPEGGGKPGPEGPAVDDGPKPEESDRSSLATSEDASGDDLAEVSASLAQTGDGTGRAALFASIAAMGALMTLAALERRPHGCAPHLKGDDDA